MSKAYLSHLWPCCFIHSGSVNIIRWLACASSTSLGRLDDNKDISAYLSISQQISAYLSISQHRYLWRDVLACTSACLSCLCRPHLPTIRGQHMQQQVALACAVRPRSICGRSLENPKTEATQAIHTCKHLLANIQQPAFIHNPCTDGMRYIGSPYPYTGRAIFSLPLASCPFHEVHVWEKPCPPARGGGVLGGMREAVSRSRCFRQSARPWTR